jgi:hypothetical protein
LVVIFHSAINAWHCNVTGIGKALNRPKFGATLPNVNGTRWSRRASKTIDFVVYTNYLDVKMQQKSQSV